MKTNWIIIAALVTAGAGGQAGATRVAGAAAPLAGAVRHTETAGEKAAAADDASSMREGAITGVSARHDQVEISGNWLKVVEGTTHVFRQGRAVGIDALAQGQRVKFTLAPGGAGRTVLGAVYVP